MSADACMARTCEVLKGFFDCIEKHTIDLAIEKLTGYKIDEPDVSLKRALGAEALGAEFLPARPRNDGGDVSSEGA